MQWVEKVIRFFSLFFRSNAFKKKYRTKQEKKLKRILQSKKWQVIDIRNSVSYTEHHLKDTVNIPKTDFARKYYRLIDQKKKLLILNQDYRSNLDIYRLLKKHNLKAYILMMNYDQLRNDVAYDDLTVVTVY